MRRVPRATLKTDSNKHTCTLTHTHTHSQTQTHAHFNQVIHHFVALRSRRMPCVCGMVWYGVVWCYVWVGMDAEFPLFREHHFREVTSQAFIVTQQYLHAPSSPQIQKQIQKKKKKRKKKMNSFNSDKSRLSPATVRASVNAAVQKQDEDEDEDEDEQEQEEEEEQEGEGWHRRINLRE